MAILDRRVPAVYVDIEDRSYVGPQPDLDRGAYVVIISDRGEHNRVVEVNEWNNDFVLRFGEPNIDKTGQAHYLCWQHLKYSKRLYVVRVADEEATYGNIIIKYNDPNGSSQQVFGGWTFTNGSDIVECAAPEPLDFINIDDLVYAPGDSPTFAKKVIDKVKDTDTSTFQLILESAYEGSTVTNADYLLVYYPGSWEASGNFHFNQGSNQISVDDSSSLNGIKIGNWIYAADHDSSYARQIINVDYYERLIVLDAPYEGDTTSGNARIYTPFELVSLPHVNEEKEIDPNDTDNLWCFMSRGVGSWYNNVYIKAVRNTEYETLYIDENGEPIYKYAFLNLSIYEMKEDGSLKLLEGPWLVSLIRTTKEGSVIRNIVTGEELYIENVINKNSKIIKCISCLGTDVLLNSEDAELKRLQVLSLFSEGKVLKLETIGQNGFSLENGSDGNQYNSEGKLDLTTNLKLRGKIVQAYNGTLNSVDGSVENITQSVYPWYRFAYVYAGGYDAIVQNAARELADIREDCLLLADTGSYKRTPDEDLSARLIDVPWNSMHSMIYTQYRTFDCPFTGKTFYITPVFDAIENHLQTDAKYWISEPVANIEKGALSRSCDLVYRPNEAKTGDLLDAELNPTIVEPDGVYLISQLTTYKRLSILKRAHAVKFIHFLRQEIPRVLKDILQRKDTKYWEREARERVNSFMRQFLDNGDFDRYATIYWYDVKVEFDDVTSELIILVPLKIIRAIERITVRIIVY